MVRKSQAGHIDDASFDHSTFSKNRERLLSHQVAPRFLGIIVRMARRKNLVSEEHFSVDGTLIDAWASMKSFKRKDGSSGGGDRSSSNPSVDFHGERRSNETHASTTDPQAKLAKKGRGKESRLAFMGHALMENRNGLFVGIRVTQASGKAEVQAAEQLVREQLRQGVQPDSVGGDKGYGTNGFVATLREHHIRPHVAIQEGRRILAGTKKTKVRGRQKVEMALILAGCALNLMRIAKLAPPGAALARP